MFDSTFGQPSQPLLEKLGDIRWALVILICVPAAVGGAMLYSAADGSIDPWASRHLIRFGAALCMTLVVAVVDLRVWLRYAYIAYVVALILLAAVEVAGTIGMGAQRWLDLGIINLQPSEVMKVALVLALARYFHGLSLEEPRKITRLFIPVLIVLLPVALVLKQPDLGTAVMLLAVGASVFFVAGVPIWMLVLAAGSGCAMLPIAWQFLHDYQRQRVLTFLNPESDPLGTGYHIIQSKIALGSGGLFGKGFMQGSQSQLNFLPEKQTDFIFTMLAEELGLVGALSLLFIYMLIIFYCLRIAFRCRSQFGRLVAMGLTTAFFLYVFINTAMVMGLVPVVGVPLPLISYGGTAILSLMFGFGLILSCHVHRDLNIPRHSTGTD